MKNFKISLSIGLILSITFVAFFPCLKNGFVLWDDNDYVIDNTVIKSLSLYSAKSILTSFFVGNYQPVTILSYLLEYQFFKLNPFGYHLTNLILHLFNCLLVFWFIAMLSGRGDVALITAILFGVHPLHVESVAWISERKDVLYAFFFLGAAICYLKFFREKQKFKYYLFSILLFVLSLLSKSMAITLPLILLLIEYLLYRKHGKYMFIDKLPFFILSLIFGIIAIHSQNSWPLSTERGLYNLLEKFVILSYCVTFYLNKMLMPLGLSCLYPYSGNMLQPLYPAVFIGYIIAVIISCKYTRKFIFGSAFFLIIISPVLQLMPLGEAIVADRYTYVASIGIFYVLAEMFIWMSIKQVKYSRILSGVLIGTICVLVFLTWNRCKVWHDSISLWSDVIKKYPNALTAYNNRGVAFYLKGEYGKAQADFNHLREPDSNYSRRSKTEKYTSYILNLSNLYNSDGQHEKAVVLLENAIKNDPRHEYNYYINLAISYAEIGKVQQAVALLEKLIENNANKCKAYYNLGLIYKDIGNLDKAIALFNKSIEIDPGFADGYWGLGIIYHDANDIKKAIGYYKKAAHLDQNNEKLYNNLAVAYISIAGYREAIKYSKKAIKINSNFAEAYANLGNSYCAISRNKEAILSLKKALQLNPNLGVAHNNLAVAYYYEKKYDLAIEHCGKAIKLGYEVCPKFLESLKNTEHDIKE